MKKSLLYIISVFLLSTTFAQKEYANFIIDHLCADSLYGRGYSHQGERKAAEFIRAEFQRLGIDSFVRNTYFQEFDISINSFPDSIHLNLNDKELRSGKDFIVHPASGSGNGSFDAVELPIKVLTNPKKFVKKVGKGKLDSVYLIVDMDKFKNNKQKELYNHTFQTILQFDGFSLGGVLEKSSSKLTWHHSTQYTSIPIYKVNSDSFPDKIKTVKAELKNKFHPAYFSQNVIAAIPGKSKIDSYIVVTAHYDHLGIMGPDVIFKGANDNASGVAMMMNLAKHYAKPENQPEYTMIFIAFGSEEIALTGSSYFVHHPLIPLDKIKVLLNFDLLGTGSKGLAIVNGISHPEDVKIFKAINEKYNYLPKFKIRNNARNSDHYHFARKKVKAFFFYTMGGIQAYHDIYDLPKTLPLTKFNEVFQLMVKYINLQNNPSYEW